MWGVGFLSSLGASAYPPPPHPRNEGGVLPPPTKPRGSSLQSAGKGRQHPEANRWGGRAGPSLSSPRSPWEGGGSGPHQVHGHLPAWHWEIPRLCRGKWP